MMRRNTFHLLLFVTLLAGLFASCKTIKQPAVTFADIKNPKREFRGAWLSTAWQDRYKHMNSEQMKRYFVESLDKLHAIGINAVIFQARPYADAFYNSNYELWSAWLTGTQGVAPDDNFDPLAFLIEEAHKRSMELHAWLNPYRVTASVSDVLSSSNIYYKYPERFVSYGGKKYFDPGNPVNAEYFCTIIKDILMHYDVDAIHMDDYFYPYPISGESFPDDISFQKWGKLQGFAENQRGDWRRNNITQLVKDIKNTISSTKPWVRFGISPFGIYRNKRNTPDASGSETNGLQNYDDLYADIDLWVRTGLIDYNMPQVYWEIGHSAADYNTLVKWWAENNIHSDCQLYIGQDVRRTMDAKMISGDNQLQAKIQKARSFSTVSGSCFWPVYDILENYKGIANQLETEYFKVPALIPPFTATKNRAPKKVENLREEYTPIEHSLQWESVSDKFDPETAQYYVVYRFQKGEKQNIENATKIVSVTSQKKYVIPYEGGSNQYKYIVTAVNRFHNESKGRAKSIKQ